MKIPISGTFENPDAHVWTAVTTLLRNAFIRALVPRLDEIVTLKDVEQPELQRSKPPRSGFTPPKAPAHPKGKGASGG